nr:hypothetical protein [Helicobacter sp. 'CLO3_human']
MMSDIASILRDFSSLVKVDSSRERADFSTTCSISCGSMPVDA